MKKTSMLLAFVILLSIMPTARLQAADTIRVVLDGTELSFDVPPQNINGRIMLPLRAVFEAMGASIEWDGTTQTVTATRADTTVILQVGNTAPTVNGQVVTIDQPCVIVDSRTLAPLRFVAEAFGGTVEWDGDTQTATIFTDGTVTVAPPSEPTPPRQTISAQVGEIIQFGGYDWRVLDVRDGRALIISENIIEYRAYNEARVTAITWEQCSLREYLNGDFYNSFSVSDRERIAETTVINSDNPNNGTPGGNNTTDRIFLLSIDEATTYFANNGARVARDANNNASPWWLRSPATGSNAAANVSRAGTVFVSGLGVAAGTVGVRPALWLNL